MARDQFQLPPPSLRGELSLEEALSSRHSAREFSACSLQLAEIGQLLWAAQGITDRAEGRRAAPSAGALYSLEIYLVAGRVEGLPPGVFHYDPARHLLEQRSAHDVRSQLSVAAHHQPWVANGAALVIIAGVEERLARKYGQRAARYTALEAGHAAQNLLLQATVRGLAAVPVGAFEDAAVADGLGLSDSEHPLYLLPVGRP